jgi:hypothetical protein
MYQAARLRMVACAAAVLLQLFGSVGPIWMLAAQAADPLAGVELCSAHIGGDRADAGTAPAHQPPFGGMCSHCQWCHTPPLTPVKPPLGVAAPGIARMAAQIPAIDPAPHTSQPRAVSARVPPILT